MDFKEIYKPPFKAEKDGIYIVSANGVRTFTVAANNTKDEAEYFVGLLNGEGKEKYDDVLIFGDHKIVTSHASVFIVRGIGYLLGIESMSLGEAYGVQDDFIKWVIERIKK